MSVVVLSYNMRRELPRTLLSLSRSYQRTDRQLRWEVLVVDNGSSDGTTSQATLRGLEGDFRWIAEARPHPSPAAAANRAVRACRGECIVVVLDGARMVTPGAVQGAIHAMEFSAATGPGVATIPAFHLGPKHQSISIAEGYCAQVEDALLREVGWPENGYALFNACSLAGANPGGFVGSYSESCFLVMGRRTWDQVGGFDERFDLPGGGLVSLDLWKRSVERLPVRVILGEGSFHQVHGGVSTSPNAPREAWKRQYEWLRGQAYSIPRMSDVKYLGSIGEESRKWLAV